MAGYLRLPGEPQNGFIVPDSSVVRQAAQGWIYVQILLQPQAGRQVMPGQKFGSAQATLALALQGQ